MSAKGQAFAGKLAEWIAGYMHFSDSRIALVCALWAINTWVFDKFDAVPYLCVTAATKGAGKTRLMELLKMVSQNGRMFGDMTPAAMFRLIEAYDSKLTIFFDEAEKLSSAATGVMRSVMNTGYRQGQTVTRAKPGGGVDEFPVYGPKCFALIGDVNDTLRDRSIVLTLERGKPGRDFSFAQSRGEAENLAAEFRELAAVMPWIDAPTLPGFLNDREREIWSAIFSVAHWLKLDKATMETLTWVAADLVSAKTADARNFREVKQDEGAAMRETYGERAMQDLRRVFKDGEVVLGSVEAVKRLREIPDGPWRMYRGSGLNEIILADLVNPFGVRPKLVRVARGKGARGASPVRGYSRKDVQASSAVDKG